jgi:hypothetical protein
MLALVAASAVLGLNPSATKICAEGKPSGIFQGRRAMLGAAFAAAVLPSAQQAQAWCGDPVPSWAYYLKWDENPAIPFEYDGVKGQVPLINPWSLVSPRNLVFAADMPCAHHLAPVLLPGGW